jgi:hypothetical protein
MWRIVANPNVAAWVNHKKNSKQNLHANGVMELLFLSSLSVRLVCFFNSIINLIVYTEVEYKMKTPHQVV